MPQHLPKPGAPVDPVDESPETEDGAFLERERHTLRKHCSSLMGHTALHFISCRAGRMMWTTRTAFGRRTPVTSFQRFSMRLLSRNKGSAFGVPVFFSFALNTQVPKAIEETSTAGAL